MRTAPNLSEAAISRLVREDWGRLNASLIRVVGDFQLVEDCLQEAIESALSHWNRNGVPNSPAGWILTVARRRAIDRIRRDRNFQSKQGEYARLLELERVEGAEVEMHDIEDERLRLIFTCCHPALEPPTRVALTLRTLGGLTTAEIARAFLAREDAMAQRLVRAKKKIRAARIGFKIPEAGEWPERLDGVLGVIYLIFNEGYSATSGDEPIRQELCDEALRLCRALDQLAPGEAEIEGLLALVLLHMSRRDSRHDEEGFVVTLDRQDRSKWDRSLIREGRAILDRAVARNQAGPYQIQAAISAIHASAPGHVETDWNEIVLLYERLHGLYENPVVLLNRGVAVSWRDGPEAALAAIEPLADALSRYQPYHAAKADFLRRAGRPGEAAECYQRAIELSGNNRERFFLQDRLKQVLN